VAGVGLGPTRTVSVPNATGGGSSPVRLNAVNALIRAIVSQNSTNILATPQILALDNTEATFEVGDTEPIRNQTIGQGGVSSFSSTNQEAKLSLKITPQINKVTRFVKLKINQKIDDFKAAQSSDPGLGKPTTTRTAITEVMVRDRDTIAMGGLLRDREVVINSKVPLLGDIPVLGWLFKNKSRTIQKVNILFFMTPKILSPYAKTASANTKSVLERRQQGMKEMFAEDETDPNGKMTGDLNAKLDQQIQGPLYDLTDAAHYKNLNDEDIQPSEEDEEVVPDYQEIIKEKSVK
jgi:general secretion pathway protein D